MKNSFVFCRAKTHSKKESGPLGGWELAVLIFLFGAISSFGGNTRIQSIQLDEGWNSIWLAVEPLSSDPSVLFADTPVDIAAAYDGVFSTRQFTSNPSANMLSILGWGVWYSPERPDSFLTELGSVSGQKPYLLHATESYTLQIEGVVEAPLWLWQPNAFNLVGTTLSETAPPSFSQFFSASKAHEDCVVYRLSGGTWQKVLAPESAQMRSGEAFWIYCNGSSDFQGPLRVGDENSGELFLSATGDEVVLENETDYPLVPELSHVPGADGGLPLDLVVEVVGGSYGMKSVRMPLGEGAWTKAFPTLEPGDGLRVPLALHQETMTVSEANTLLCIRTDIGTETWLPVLGSREDLK